MSYTVPSCYALFQKQLWHQFTKFDHVRWRGLLFDPVLLRLMLKSNCYFYHNSLSILTLFKALGHNQISQNLRFFLTLAKIYCQRSKQQSNLNMKMLEWKWIFIFPPRFLKNVLSVRAFSSFPQYKLGYQRPQH